MPYVGVQKNVVDHMSDVQLVPRSLIEKAQKHAANVTKPTTLSDFGAVSLMKQMSVLDLRRIEHRESRRLKKFKERNLNPQRSLCPRLMQAIEKDTGTIVNSSMMQSDSIKSLQVDLAKFSPRNKSNENCATLPSNAHDG